MSYTQRAKLRAAVAAGLTALTCLTLLFRFRLAPMARSLMAIQVDNQASDAINASIAEQIADGEIDYDRIVTVEKDADGTVTAIRANMAEINRLKTSILSRIDEKLESASLEKLSVPLGSFVFPELFSGQGPGVAVQVIAVRTSDAAFHNSFSSAGINQTLHEITITIHGDVTIVTVAGTQEIPVDATVMIAQTVIVGTVPTTYFGMEEHQ